MNLILTPTICDDIFPIDEDGNSLTVDARAYKLATSALGSLAQLPLTFKVCDLEDIYDAATEQLADSDAPVILAAVCTDAAGNEVKFYC